MAKFYPSKFSREEQEELFVCFCEGISRLRSPLEAARFLKDLLSVQEAEMLAKRLKAAELLILGLTYSEIRKILKISNGTIARVHEWLKLSGDGYRLILERMQNEKKTGKSKTDLAGGPFSWRSVKRKYPLYFWPQLLLENIIKTAKENDRRKLRALMNKLDKKSALYKRINLVFSS